MSKIKLTLAMLALGGLSAAGAHAVTPVTVVLDIPYGGGYALTPINLVGGPGDTAPQFYFGSFDSPPFLSSADFASNQFFKGLLTYQYGAVGDKSSTNPGFPAFNDVTEPYNFVLDGATYIQLAFLNGSQAYVGYAYVDATGELDYITYEAVPEPAAWALLIAGVGLAGAAVRTRRRKELAQAA